MDTSGSAPSRWRGRYSSSIANFHEKLDKRLKLNRKFSLFAPTIFIGMYHWVDYIRFIFHLGEKKIFWCGSDILALEKTWVKKLILGQNKQNFVENWVEFKKLDSFGSKHVNTIPMIFDDPDKYPICYKPSPTPRVFATYHKGREKEYGYFEHPQVDWFCDLSEDEFNEKIKEYQGCIRLNRFDGFAESLAKSVLMGQYQYSAYIGYPGMESRILFDQWLEKLANQPVNPLAIYWRRTLEESKQILLS